MGSGRKKSSKTHSSTTILIFVMCQLATEGTKHGCGHYIVTRNVAKRDCGTRYCMKSRFHMNPCPHCPHCARYYGPDYEQKTTYETLEYCAHCEYWFKGPGSIPRKPR